MCLYLKEWPANGRDFVVERARKDLYRNELGLWTTPVWREVVQKHGWIISAYSIPWKFDQRCDILDGHAVHSYLPLSYVSDTSVETFGQKCDRNSAYAIGVLGWGPTNPDIWTPEHEYTCGSVAIFDPRACENECNRRDALSHLKVAMNATTAKKKWGLVEEAVSVTMRAYPESRHLIKERFADYQNVQW